MTKYNFNLDRDYSITFIPDQYFECDFVIDHTYSSTFVLPTIKNFTSAFVIDLAYNGIFLMLNIGETEIGDMDGKTLGYYDPKTLLEIIMPS